MRTLDPATLDPGIRDVVDALRACGWDTCDSGDGSKRGEGTLPFPHVAIVDPAHRVDVPGSARAILAVVNSTDGREGWIVEAGYCTADGVLTFVASLPGAEVVDGASDVPPFDGRDERLARAIAEGIETARRLGQSVTAATDRLDEAVSILRVFIAAEDMATTSSGRGFDMYNDAMTRARELMAPLARSTEAPLAKTIADLRALAFEVVVKALVEWANAVIVPDDALLAPVVALARRAVKASNGADGCKRGPCPIPNGCDDAGECLDMNTIEADHVAARAVGTVKP